jgi:hypothetical protein
MGERGRFYLAGVLHGVAGMLLVGWACGHWPRAQPQAFGPTGVLPVALVPGLIVFGAVLVALRRRGGGPEGPAKP